MPEEHWSQLKGNALVIHPCVRVWVPSPLAGKGQDGGKTDRALLLTPSLILPRQGGGEKKRRLRLKL